MKNLNIIKIIMISFFAFQYMMAGSQVVFGPIGTFSFEADPFSALGNLEFEADSPFPECKQFGEDDKCQINCGTTIEEEARSTCQKDAVISCYQEPLETKNRPNLNVEEYKISINNILREMFASRKKLLKIMYEIEQMDESIYKIIQEKNRRRSSQINFNGIFNGISLIVYNNQNLENRMKEMQEEKRVLLSRKEHYKNETIQFQKIENELVELFPSKELFRGFTFDPDVRELSTLSLEDIRLLKEEGIICM
jgi:hypothetical protein